LSCRTSEEYCTSRVFDKLNRKFDMDYRTASSISEEVSASFMIISVWLEALAYLKSLCYDFYFNFKILNRMDLLLHLQLLGGVSYLQYIDF
jgi:hypothetical protein